MISKKVSWSVLAQCDYFAVRSLVETEERPAMKTVAPLRETVFRNKILKDHIWRETYEKVCSAYQQLAPQFSISYDNFGGYRLLYKGKKPVNATTVLKKNPIGFVRTLPDGVANELSVMSSERTGEQLILLGPIRFINSDCNPNAEYDFSSDSGIVQIRLRKRINPGDEISVKYGPEFFELNECRCRTCALMRKNDLDFEIAFDILVEDMMFEYANEVLTEVEKQPSPDHSPCPISKKRRIKGRQLVDLINDLESSPVSTENSPSCTQPDFVSEASVSKRVFRFNTASPVVFSDSDSECIEEVENCSDSEIESASRSNSPISGQPSAPVIERASSPLRLNVSLSCSLSSVSENQRSISTIANCNYENIFEEKLFDGSSVSSRDANVLTEMFCSRFNLTDECAGSMHSLIKLLLPDNNSFPSGFSHLKKIKENFVNEVRVMTKTEESTTCVFSFRFQIRDIIPRHLFSILQYSDIRNRGLNNDFSISLCPVFSIKQNQKATVNLIVFADGVNIKKSTFKKEVWPVWIQVADLPPKLRMSRKNIVLASLFVGPSHPKWEELVPHLRAELLSGLAIEINEHMKVEVDFKARMLVCDLGAKCHMLNMIKFNGYFGCHFCTVEGATIGRSHCYYPYNQHGQIREPHINNLYANLAEVLSVDQSTKVVGVKGKSAFSNLIDGLPLTAPIDYMHCVLLGVFPIVLKLCYQALTPDSRAELSYTISRLSCPRELISYSRKIRQLDDLAQFKANEMINWCFYISFLAFRGRIPNELYSHIVNLISGVRLLLESNCQKNLNAARIYLQQFCSNVLPIHGNERSETINVHSLSHLVDQVQRFGPLFCFSAMSFEAANRTLGEVCSGSNSECEIICRRVLQRYKLLDTDIEDPNLRTYFNKLTGRSDYEKENSKFDKELIETEAVEEARKQYPDAEILNRQILDGVYFDSPAYKRSKLGNCFVSFQEGGDIFFGKIQYFIKIPGPPFYNEVLANVQLFNVLENMGPEKGFFYRIEFTEKENLISLNKLSKIFLCRVFCDEVELLYAVKLCTSFEHS